MTSDSSAEAERPLTDPEVYDHVRPTAADPDAEADVPPGVYRVVGASGGSVTLLRVGDADGRRVNTGEVVTVDAPLEGFERADNPDGNRSGGAALRSLLSGAYWSVRAFASSLAAHPLATALGLALIVAGSAGGDALPDPLPSVLVFGGALALAYVGGGGL